MNDNGSLKKQVLTGGLWLTIRENVNLVVRIFGAFALMRFLTPGQYGTYAAVSAIGMFIASISQLGVNVYLTKYDKDDFHEACSASLTAICPVSAAAALLYFAFIPLCTIATHLTGITALALAMFSFIPVSLLRMVPLGIMERALKYKELSQIEITAQALFYLIGIPLAVAGWGAWAPTSGLLVMNAYSTVETIRKSGYTFKFSRDKERIKDVYRYGFGYSFSSMGWQIRSLILPFVVAPLSNAQTVGYIALAARIADSLNLLREATRRVSVSALSRVQSDSEKFRAAIAGGIGYQMIALGPALLLFVLFSRLLIANALGAHWLAIIPLFPFVAFNALCNAFGTVQTAALYVKDKSLLVALSFYTQHVLMALATWLFIVKYGMIGYGYALFVPIPAYCLLVWSVRRAIGSVNYTTGLIWLFSCAVPLFYREMGAWTLLCAAVPFCFQKTRSQLAYIVKVYRPKGLLPWQRSA